MVYKRKKIKKILFRVFIAGVLIIAIFFEAKAVSNIYNKNNIAKNERNSVEEKYIEAQNRYDSLSAELSKLKTKKGLEEEVRKKFYVSKPDEHIVILIDEDNNKNKEKKEKKGILRSIIDFLMRN